MNYKDEISKALEEHIEYQEALFCRGYVVTNNTLDYIGKYPFYNNWKKFELGVLDKKIINIYYHKWQECYVQERDGITIGLIGHAYNPFNMKYLEEDIIKECIEAYKKNKEVFFDKISELTGIHLIVVNNGDELLIVQDCGGMKTCYYGKIDNYIYLTSHPQLIGDLCDLTIDSFVRKLKDKWFFSIGGKYLPGNLSPYKELKRLGPNTYVSYSKIFKVKRFYPIKDHIQVKEDEYDKTLEEIGKLINKNIELCSLKWDRPAISLSGGMDSKTTLACANGLYDKFKYYSFHCKEQEIQDANAAHTICDRIGVNHKIYAIPDTNEEISDYEMLKKIIYHNTSYVGNPPEHEIRKFIYLFRLEDFDVELKSWISEIGRAMWERKYGITLPEILTPRHFSIFQTRYFGAPYLLKRSDEYYREYLKETGILTPLYNYEHSDIFYWEFRFGSWGGNVVTAQDIFRHTVTMPMNNRKLIEMFLWFPHEFRKNDLVNKGIIKASNKVIDDLDITVHNTYLGGRRILVEKLYYLYRTWNK